MFWRMATERETYLQGKLDRLYEMTGRSPGMPIEEALQRAEGEWVDDPDTLSDKELSDAHDILLAIVDDLPDARHQAEAAEERFRSQLTDRGFSPRRPRSRILR